MIIGYLNNTPQKISIKRICQVYYLRWWYNGWHYWAFKPGQQSLITEGEKYRTIGTKSVLMGSGQITYEQCEAIRTIMNTREVYILTSDGWKNVSVAPGSLVVFDNQASGYEVELSVKIGSKEISQTGFSPIVNIPAIPIPDPGLCEAIIGTQIWMCKNYDSNFPGSKVYNDDEANRAIYGGLYSFAQIMTPGFCPGGWHIPTLKEWQDLITFLGGTAGGKLKEVGTNHWNAPNTGAVDTFGFKALGAGSYFAAYNFYGLKTVSNIWANANDDTKSYFVNIFHNSSDLTISSSSVNNYYFSVRLIKDVTAPLVTYNDYFLPSQDGLLAMYAELKAYNVGNFADTEYWSSSEGDDSNAYYSEFATTGEIGGASKSQSHYVRACRAFTSLINYNLRDIGPAGGLVFWKSGNNYMECPLTDQSAGKVWSNIDSVAVGATAQGTAIGTGQANTTAIINQVGHMDSAAKLCDDLVIIH